MVVGIHHFKSPQTFITPSQSCFRVQALEIGTPIRRLALFLFRGKGEMPREMSVLQENKISTERGAGSSGGIVIRKRGGETVH